MAVVLYVVAVVLLCLCRCSGSSLCCLRALMLLLVSPNSSILLIYPGIPGTVDVTTCVNVLVNGRQTSDLLRLYTNLVVLDYHFSNYHFLTRVLAISACYCNIACSCWLQQHMQELGLAQVSMHKFENV